METLAYGLSVGWLVGKLAVVFAEMMGGIVYTLRQTKRLQSIAKHPYARRLRRRPLITVVVYACNAETTIEQCLSSIIKSNYQKLEIIVIEYGSQDQTRQIMRQFLKSHPTRTIRLIFKRKPFNFSEILLPRDAAHGELVVRLPANAIVCKDTFQKAAQHFAIGYITCLLPTLRVEQHKSIVGLVQHFDILRRTAVNALGIAPRSQLAFVSQSTSGSPMTYFADNVIVRFAPARTWKTFFENLWFSQPKDLRRALPHSKKGSYRQDFQRMRALILLTEPVFIGYFIYQLFEFHITEPLIMAWALGVFSLIFYVTAHSHSTRQQKVRLICLAPGIYPLTCLNALYMLISFFSRTLHKIHVRIVTIRPRTASNGRITAKA